jgi:hypothetical protein
VTAATHQAGWMRRAGGGADARVRATDRSERVTRALCCT